MEKESYPQESAPPYPGPPMDYGQPPMYAPPSFPTPPGFPTQPGYPAVPAGHHGGIICMRTAGLFAWAVCAGLCLLGRKLHFFKNTNNCSCKKPNRIQYSFPHPGAGFAYFIKLHCNI
uniref:Uncharacterized protein n=1 Tax=Poecilia mexicana TaxID=48701 RepID=A0A3B3YWT4_9TELE